MITEDVVLNCNHSLFKNYRKKFREMETRRKHITQIERNLESLSALVLILKEVFLSFTFGKKQRRIDQKLSIYTKIVTTENRCTSYNIFLKIEYNSNEITTCKYC
jgi:hypothetical protein